MALYSSLRTAISCHCCSVNFSIITHLLWVHTHLESRSLSNLFCMTDDTYHLVSALKTRQVLRRQTLKGLTGEPAEAIWVVEPRRNPDAEAELLVAATYEAIDMGRHCVPVIEVQDRDGRRCLGRRYRSDWRTFTSLARPEGAGWAVNLPAALLRRDAARIALLDYLLANPNRHGHSLLLDLDGRRLLAADHGLCLGQEGPSLATCQKAGPMGDLGLTDQEMEEALSWWEGAQWAAEKALGARFGEVRARLGLAVEQIV